MTHASQSPATRETSTLIHRRPLIVQLTAHEAVLREKGRRDRVTVPWEAVYQTGMKLRAIEAAKANPKKNRRKRR